MIHISYTHKVNKLYITYLSYLFKLIPATFQVKEAAGILYQKKL